MSKEIVIKHPNEQELVKKLSERTDIKAERIKRLMALPDLTKKANSPVKFLTEAIIRLPRFKDFDIVDFPRIVTVEENFDLLNAPKDHPSRRETDTYYLDEKNILRTQMTAMWSYYLRDQSVLDRLETDGLICALAPGIVFRKDEVDRKHFPAFHQIDGLLISKKSKKVITLDDLKEVEKDITETLFGKNTEYRFLEDSFPFTDPSVQIEVMFNNDWLEVVGSGLVHPQVLKNFGLDPEQYNGWAFGFGLERLAMLKMEIPDIRVLWSEDPRITGQFKDFNSKFKEVSKYPEVIRDISFVIDKSVNLNNYYEIVRDCAGSTNLIEEVKLVDEFENAQKFGADKKSYTFRITYRSHERTLTNEEVNKIQEEIIAKTKSDLKAVVR